MGLFSDFVYLESSDLQGGNYSFYNFPGRLVFESLDRLRAYGCFEVMEAKNSVVFHGNEHIERLWNSVCELNLTLPRDLGKDFGFFKRFLYEKIKNVLMCNNLHQKQAIIRLEIGGGATNDGLLPIGSAMICISVKPFKEPSFDEKGINVMTVDYAREFPDIKTTNYCFALKTLNNPNYANWDDVLYTNICSKPPLHNPYILECSTSNMFIVKGVRVFTPKNNVLPGVTRFVIMEIAKKLRYEPEEKDLRYSDLESADEVFLTNTLSFIRPVKRIDEFVFGFGGVPGSVTRFLRDKFQEYRQNYYKVHTAYFCW